ncbi:hypothetical protein [Aeromonas phage ZPAH34]|uniref:hypothetical protein n=1 Tax=Aeromonas phage ZPAH34 TaxID=2924888 RepID=UPI00232988F1|nr:hypothetical protein PQD16_gp162 [Aeromonas phage ZPAH34]UOX39521.1 hypothetical protein [Aeromonas phage ZPAH34]
MKHITQANNLQAYQIEIAGVKAVLFYSGCAGTVVEELKLPADFTVVHEFTPDMFTWCDWLSDYIDIIYNQNNSKEDMTLRKLLYCLEDECYYLCDYTTYNDYVIGIIFPDTLDLSNNRLGFGFCDEECFFGIMSDKPIRSSSEKL